MKIKEKGLTGKSAVNRRESMVSGGPRPRAFNAFQEMAKAKSGSKSGGDKPKPEIWLEFMGSKIRVHEKDGGSVDEADVPYIEGASLKFTGCGGTLNFKDIKVSTFFYRSLNVVYVGRVANIAGAILAGSVHQVRER